MAKTTGTAGRVATVPTAGAGDVTQGVNVALNVLRPLSVREVAGIKANLIEFQARTLPMTIVRRYVGLGLIQENRASLTPAGWIIRGDTDMQAQVRRLGIANAATRRDWAELEAKLGGR